MLFLEQDDMILKTEGYTVEDLLNKITSVNSDEFLIKAEWDVFDIIPNAEEEEINTDGYLVFSFEPHDDYFYVERKMNLKEVEEFILKFNETWLIEDIIVIYNGKILKYKVEKELVKWL